MISLEHIFGGPRFEFERPICIVECDASLKYSVDQLEVLEKSTRDEMDRIVKEAAARHESNWRFLWLAIEAELRRMKAYPESYDKTKDMLELRDGVIYHVRKVEGGLNEKKSNG